MVKVAKEIQMENPREAETPSTGATCSPSEEQAEKPSMLCFKKRKKPCKKGLTVKDPREGASEEKSQCVSASQGEANVSNPSRPSKGAWTAIKNLTRPRRRQKSSSRMKVPSDSQVQLEVDAEESCAQGVLKKRVSSGVKMPCVRFSRGRKRSSPSEAVEESEDSVQANEVVGVLNKASEKLEELAPTEKPESFSPVSAEEDHVTVAVKESDSSIGKRAPLTEPTPDAEEHTECTVQLEITDSATASETAQDKLQQGSLPPTVDHVEGGEVVPEVSVSPDKPGSAPGTAELQEIPTVCKELPDSGKSPDLPEEAVLGLSEEAPGGAAASVQGCSSHQGPREASAGTGIGIIITITEAEDSDNTDSDQAYEPSPVLQQNKQKGNKKSSKNADAGLGEQGHRTGEQYELLLIETASSLVKAAIQSSIEQLVSEMALEQNKHNSFL
ncbi:A-kinase anchor protein 5 [Acanthisitta chloris]|uniref:A-kinase anchor protein 5 n=1 Tax=Acanthisitta chloris TaxID=57068 RepID=A0A091NCY5_9PASS|nr:A-kinase anchor protein 5 [Acanthisitta chloris]